LSRFVTPVKVTSKEIRAVIVSATHPQIAVTAEVEADADGVEDVTTVAESLAATADVDNMTTAAESPAATAEVDDVTTVVKSTEISHRLKDALLLKVCHMLMVNGFATKSCHVSSVK